MLAPLRRTLRLVRRAVRNRPLPALPVTRSRTYPEYRRLRDGSAAADADRRRVEDGLIAARPEFTVPGWCAVCRRTVPLRVDDRHAPTGAGRRAPNWRESLSCPRCRLNNRMRAAVHLFARECRPGRASRVYLTEQTTPLYWVVQGRYAAVTGSEFLGDRVPLGRTSPEGLRNESVTALTFPTGAFDFVLSFEVLEHVPDYRAGFAECLRVLKPGGALVFTVPFTHGPDTVVRARVRPDGGIDHLLPPEYHGDPLSPDGCLCFHHFGFDLLDRLREMGYADAAALTYWSREFGYLGDRQVLFLATKPAG